MALYLSKGRLVFALGAEGKKLKLKSREKCSDGKWHTVSSGAALEPPPGASSLPVAEDGSLSVLPGKGAPSTPASQPRDSCTCHAWMSSQMPRRAFLSASSDPPRLTAPWTAPFLFLSFHPGPFFLLQDNFQASRPFSESGMLSLEHRYKGPHPQHLISCLKASWG